MLPAINSSNLITTLIDYLYVVIILANLKIT